jgi:hypothetical protein
MQNIPQVFISEISGGWAAIHTPADSPVLNRDEVGLK